MATKAKTLTQDEQELISEAIISLKASIKRLAWSTNDKDIRKIYLEKQNRLDLLKHKIDQNQNMDLEL